jgi:hypothetical protein
MDWDDMLALITLGAVLPYASAAAGCWLKRCRGEHGCGAHAPN